MKIKPQHAIAIGAGVLLLFALIAMQRGTRSSGLSRTPGQDSDTSEQVSFGRPITRISRNVSRSLDLEKTPNPTRINRIGAKDREEDFDAQKYRAFGNSAVYGHVLDEKGRAIAGATVQLYENDPMTKNPPLRETVADSDGSFTLTQLNDQGVRFILVGRAEGFAPEAGFVLIEGEPEHRNIRLSKGVELSGAVRDLVTSEGISGATVYYPSRSETIYGLLGSVRSGSAGQFSFPSVPSGKLRILGRAEGYHQSIARTRAPTNSAEIALRPGGAVIRGVTVNRITGKPEGGARVLAASETIKDTAYSSKEDGTFEFTDLPEGDYILYAIKGMPSQRQKIKLKDREVKEGVTIVLPGDLFVSGKVVDANEGGGMPGVRVWYQSPRGKTNVMTDEDGLFAFETMAVQFYSMEVHEKNYLPVIDKKTTGVVEMIWRKVPEGAASDQVTIKMRPVPCVQGEVRYPSRGNNNSSSRNRNRGGAPARNVQVAVAYMQGNVYERVLTRTDVFGEFFVNLPEDRRGEAKVVAERRNMVAVESSRIPVRKRLKMVLQENPIRGQLFLVDKTPLSGVRIQAKYLFPDNRSPEKSIPIPGSEVFTMNWGYFILNVAPDQVVNLIFYLPDGQVVTKTFKTSQLARRRPLFIYDPVSQDILSDLGKDQRGRDQQRNSGSGNGQNRNQDQGGQKQGSGQNQRQPGAQTGTATKK